MVLFGLVVSGAGACSGQAENSNDTAEFGANTGDDGGRGGGAAGQVSGSGASSTSGEAGSGGETHETSSGGISGTGGTDSGSCPSAEPAVGAPCDLDGQSCGYPNCTAPDYRESRTLICFDNGWAVTSEQACDVEDVEDVEVRGCPSPPPSLGEACLVGSTPGPCTTTDACGVRQEAYCNDGTWFFQAMDHRNTMCPIIPPVVGASCCPDNSPEPCDYRADSTTGSGGFGGTAMTTTATVTGGPATTGGTVTGATVTGGTVTGGTVTGGSATTGGVTTTGVGSTVTGGSPTTSGTTTGGPGSGPEECMSCSPDGVWEVSSDCP